MARGGSGAGGRRRGSGAGGARSSGKPTARRGKSTGAGGRKKRGRGGREAAGRGAVLSRRRFLAAGVGAAALLVAGGGTGHWAAGRINAVGAWDPERLRRMADGGSSALFSAYPGLTGVVPWRPLGRFPTLIEELPRLVGAGDVALYVKRDDDCSPLYGGNKLRKLEHLLAEAELAGCRTLVTLGSAGTNHGLATALHGRTLGFNVQVSLFDHPASEQVRRNLRGLVAAGAAVSHGGGELGAARQAYAHYGAARERGAAPYFVMVGGSSRLGTVGFVNAALELAAQVRAGSVPEPGRIFVPLGSGGTAAGLAAGCRLAGLRTRVTAVRASQPLLANAFTVHFLANDVLRWLRDVDPDVPRVRVRYRDFDVVSDHVGAGYGQPTEAGAAAAAWAAPRLALDATYSAKALAACLHYCRTGARPGEVVLFWNTFNSTAFAEAAGAALDVLPPRLRALAQG